jgi:exo-beta-1,3-glucanase (GH17 family)
VSFRVSIVLATLLAAMPVGAAERGSDVTSTDRLQREDPFLPRPFTLRLDDRPPVGAVCYGPHRDGQRPGGPEPAVAQLREDLRLMGRHWDLLRIYGASGFADSLLSLIRDDGPGMRVMLGVWISQDDTLANRREVEAAVRLAAVYPEIVVAVSVGNETQVSWSSYRCEAELLVGYVREVRARVTVPVTTADDFNYWNKPESRALAAEIDFITLHAHPMWNGRQLDEALAWLSEQTSVVQAVHPERVVVIGETGWATSVHDEGEQARLIKGRPGEAEQKRFYDEVRAWAETERRTVFVFEAFDENWKGGPHPDEVEKHWGLYRADRSPKAAMDPASGG